MKLTVDIPEKDLHEAMRLTHAKTRTKAVAAVIAEFIQRQRMGRLARTLRPSETFMTHADLMAARTTHRSP